MSYVSRVVDLLDPSNNTFTNVSVDEARARVLSGDPASVRAIDGSFALVASEGTTVRMARSMDRPLRYFLAKRHEGPALYVADRIDTLHRALAADGLDAQFHPSYTRMVPAHYVVELALVGCPDPSPTYTRFFTPDRAALPPDLDEIGRRYIGALADEIAKWLTSIDARDAEAPIAVAFSGGVDSAVVANAAQLALGDRAVAVTGTSASLAEGELSAAREIAAQIGIRHEILSTGEFNDPNYIANPSNRCYFCKTELYGKLLPLARERQIAFVVDGSTVDDLGDYRPGRAAAREHGVRSPLIEVGMTKQEVRELSRRSGLPTWDKPASPCLSSRIAYGTMVTIERLTTVDRGEEIMRSLGFREFRVRHHDELVRLEIAPAELERALNRKVVDELAQKFRALGFRYVTLDLHGYRTGAMNEVLKTVTNDE